MVTRFISIVEVKELNCLGQGDFNAASQAPADFFDSLFARVLFFFLVLQSSSNVVFAVACFEKLK